MVSAIHSARLARVRDTGGGVYLCGGMYRDKPTLGIGGTLFGAKLQFACAPENDTIMSGSLYW